MIYRNSNNFPAIWKDAPAYIIAGGPSVNDIDLSLIKDKHIVGVNNAYQLGAFVDICWFGDSRWWDWHKESLNSFGGLIASCAPKMKGCMEGVHYFDRDSRQFGLSDKPGTVCWNGNSGASCIDFVCHLGASPIILIGFDMQPTAEGITHWHGCHKQEVALKPKRVSPYPMFLKCFSFIAEDAKKKGIEIYNSGNSSKIEDFPKRPLSDLVLSF